MECGGLSATSSLLQTVIDGVHDTFDLAHRTQEDPELEAIRQRRMAELVARQGGVPGGAPGAMAPEDQEEQEAAKR